MDPAPVMTVLTFWPVPVFATTVTTEPALAPDTVPEMVRALAARVSTTMLPVLGTVALDSATAAQFERRRGAENPAR